MGRSGVWGGLVSAATALGVDRARGQCRGGREGGRDG